MTFGISLRFSSSSLSFTFPAGFLPTPRVRLMIFMMNSCTLSRNDLSVRRILIGTDVTSCITREQPILWSAWSWSADDVERDFGQTEGCADGGIQHHHRFGNVGFSGLWGPVVWFGADVRRPCQVVVWQRDTLVELRAHARQEQRSVHVPHRYC